MINHFLHNSFFKQAAIIFGCLFVLGCENDEKVMKEWDKKEVIPEEAKHITTLFSQQGVMRAKLTAPLMLRYQSDTIVVEFPKSLHVDFFDSTAKVESQLNARYGKYFESLGKVLLRDSVIVFNIKGDTLRSPELWWDQQQQKFYTDKEVQIHRKGQDITGGKGLEAGQDFSWYVIKQPTGTVLVGNDVLPQ